MTDFTSNYLLVKLGPGENFSFNSYQFTEADRDLIDRLLYQGATGHRHNGTSTSSTAPTDVLDAVADTSGGTLAAGTKYWWVYTLTDSSGNESGASPDVSLTMPAKVTNPVLPTASISTSGGTLTEGYYYYAVTAYSTVSQHETLSNGLVLASIPVSVTTGKVTLTLGSLPSGATGFNIYRRTAGGSGIFYIGSTTSTTFDDTGLSADCDRTIPTSNTTSYINEVTLTLPGATPAPPAGSTWNLYRTSVEGNWSNSLVVRGLTGADYLDTGAATSSGQPPSSSITLSQPSKVLLTDGGEAQGVLPPGLSIYPFTAILGVYGDLTTATLQDIWECPYPTAIIKGVSCAVTNASSSQDIIVDINKNHAGATPVYASIYASQGNRPRIHPGFLTGSPTVPDDTSLILGDSLTLDVDQSDSSATPTDRNLRVTIYGWAIFTTTVSSNPPWV